MKTLVVNVKGHGSIFVESSIDRVAKRYGMEKIRVRVDPLLGSVLPTHIQYALKCGTLKAIWIVAQTMIETRYCICKDCISYGWAIEK